jgi:DNA polymerase ligase (LigD)-like protein
VGRIALTRGQNHLIETASATTGSLLIWDTGTYSVLKRRSKHDPAVDPSSQGEESDEGEARTEQEKLHEAFRQRKIRIRLDGTRLPRPYVLNLRLTKTEDAEGRVKAKKSAERGRRRRRGGRGKEVEETSSEEEEVVEDEELDAAVPEGQQPGEEEVKGASAPTEMTDEMRRELEEQEDAQVRATNAYVGADNSIGSVHQRKWFLSLDREASGFVRTAKKGQKVIWTREGDGEAEGARLHYPFYVRGPEAERSVVTGRLAADVLRDEGVRGFIGRKGWRPVLR